MPPAPGDVATTLVPRFRYSRRDITRPKEERQSSVGAAIRQEREVVGRHCVRVFFHGVKARDEIPPDKQEEFDRHVEQDGIGFHNITLKGGQLGFSLGGKQKDGDEDKTE